MPAMPVHTGFQQQSMPTDGMAKLRLMEDGIYNFFAHLPEPVLQAYLDRETWNVNGGMDTDDVQYTIDFFVETGGLPKTIPAAEVSDLSFLKAVLEEIGSN